MTSRLPWRRSAVPAVLQNRVLLKRGEKILGWSWLPSQGWAVATAEALLVVGPGLGSDEAPLRLPWHLVTSAVWAEGALEVVAAPAPRTRPETYRLEITEEGLLAEAVNTLVTGSVVWSQRVDERPTAAALISVRRAPDNELLWSVVFDKGFDANDPRLREWADERIAVLKQQTGLEG